MIDVYKLSANGQIATLVGRVHKPRDVGDKVRVSATMSPLRVIGRGPSSKPGSHAIYCVTEVDWFYGHTVFNESLFGYSSGSNVLSGKEPRTYKDPLSEQIQNASSQATSPSPLQPMTTKER